jgi:hypothetical protein
MSGDSKDVGADTCVTWIQRQRLPSAAPRPPSAPRPRASRPSLQAGAVPGFCGAQDQQRQPGRCFGFSDGARAPPNGYPKRQFTVKRRLVAEKWALGIQSPVYPSITDPPSRPADAL